MTHRKDHPKSLRDIEKPHDAVADSFSDGLVSEPLTVRLGDLWSEIVRVADDQSDPDSRPRSPAVVPLLDEMQGTLQWD